MLMDETLLLKVRDCQNEFKKKKKTHLYCDFQKAL